MSYALTIRFAAEPIRVLAETGISGTYAAVGTALVYPARQIYIVNATDALLEFSFDGVNGHFVIPAYSYLLDDISSNDVTDRGWYLAAGTILWVKEIGTPSTGSVYFSSFYGAGAS